MLRKITAGLFVIGLLLMAALPVYAGEPEPKRNADTVVYVTSLGLYFDSVVISNELPPQGNFQQLFPPGTNPAWPEGETLSTEFGPGAPGHHGGRWWIDADGDGMISEGDPLFSCPLLGPGRETP
jgi:hypothetical protein